MTGERPEEGAGGLPEDIIPLDVAYPIWERVFTVSPLVVVGTREGETYDLAPKHMVTALGWDNHFGFVCTRRHGTYRNAVNEGEFTVSFPRPDQVVLAGLSAAPRDDWHGHKRTLGALPTFDARVVNGVFLAESHLFLECRVVRVVDGFGENSLLAGRVVAAYVRRDALRASEVDDAETLRRAPLLAYLHPSRFATIEQSHPFPLPAGFRR